MDRRPIACPLRHGTPHRRHAALAVVQTLLPAAFLLLAAGCASTSGAGEGPGNEPTPPRDTAATAEADTAAAAPVPATIAARPADRRAGAGRLDTVEARRFDQGRMWTFENPPLDYLEQEYGFRPDEEWLQQARLGALRLPNCTASFVSPRGLVMTNHHCGREFAAATAGEGESILQDGFYAGVLAQERRVEDLYADQLVAIEDVTGEVQAALDEAQTDAERADAQQAVFQDIQERRNQAVEGAGLRTEVVALYNGGRYSAYTFRRYEDVRLVMIPEADVGYFGGDPDNFTYPRYTFDVSFFRVYGSGGEPLRPDAFFPFDAGGSEAGEGVFAVGNPGSTSRLETTSQLAFRRDVADQALLAFLESRLAAFEAVAGAEPADSLENQMFGLRNAIKLYRGRLRALEDPYVMARRRDAEQDFQQALEGDPALRSEYGDLIDEMDQIQEEKRQFADALRAFALIQNPSFSSATMRRGLLAWRYLERQEAGAAEQQLSALREQLLGVADQAPALDRRLLEARLRDVQDHLGDSTVQAALEGRTPAEAARALVDASALRSAAATRQALESGALSQDDPVLEVVSSLYTRFQDYQSARSGLEARQEEVARQLGRARYEVYGTDVPPDATFSLRLADGRVEGYAYNGTVAPPYTSFYGMFNHYYAYGDGTPWDLPQRWLDRQAALDLATPLNLVSTNDITGGNSGSPLLNSDLEIVGLVFDGNIESLAGDFIYLPQRARAVSVDVRGLLEALDSVYEASRLTSELRQASAEQAQATP